MDLLKAFNILNAAKKIKVLELADTSGNNRSWGRFDPLSKATSQQKKLIIALSDSSENTVYNTLSNAEFVKAFNDSKYQLAGFLERVNGSSINPVQAAIDMLK
jgi:hypothetical protein